MGLEWPYGQEKNRWNALKRIAVGASAAEKLALFSGTVRRAYRLD